MEKLYWLLHSTTGGREMAIEKDECHKKRATRCERVSERRGSVLPPRHTANRRHCASIVALGRRSSEVCSAPALTVSRLVRHQPDSSRPGTRGTTPWHEIPTPRHRPQRHPWDCRLPGLESFRRIRSVCRELGFRVSATAALFEHPALQQPGQVEKTKFTAGTRPRFLTHK